MGEERTIAPVRVTAKATSARPHQHVLVRVPRIRGQRVGDTTPLVHVLLERIRLRTLAMSGSIVQVGLVAKCDAHQVAAKQLLGKRSKLDGI